MAQSFSDYSVGSESDSSKEETIYDTIRATTEKPSGIKMEELQGNTLVIRVVIQDLQQTVSELLCTVASASSSARVSVSSSTDCGCGWFCSTLGLQAGAPDSVLLGSSLTFLAPSILSFLPIAAYNNH